MLVLVLLIGAAPARARDGDGDRREARVAATCGKGATAQLRLRSRDGEIRVELDVRRRRRGEAWRVVLVHERRLVWRATLRARGSLRVRRSLEDLDGPDRVTARASGPRGLTCEATATLPA